MSSVFQLATSLMPFEASFPPSLQTKTPSSAQATDLVLLSTDDSVTAGQFVQTAGFLVVVVVCSLSKAIPLRCESLLMLANLAATVSPLGPLES